MIWRIDSFLLYLLLLCVSLLHTVVSKILPAPTRLHAQGTESTVLSPNFKIVTAETNVFEIPFDLDQAIENAMFYIRGDNLQRLVPRRGEGDKPTLVKDAGVLYGLSLQIDSLVDPFVIPSELKLDYLNPLLSLPVISSIAEELKKLYDDPTWDESYELYVPTSGIASLSSKTSIGFLRGLQTFVQLVYTLPEAIEVEHEPLLYILDTPIHVIDAPVFKHRGFMLDTSRHFFSVEDIERTITVMSWCKMNVFHWHITDSTSFPLVIPSYPDLASKGAYSTTQTYSPSQVKHLNSFANALGVSIMLEIDVPGHTASIGESYPDTMACWNEYDLDWEGKANEPPSGQLRISDAVETRKFVKGLMKEAAGMMKSPYFSSGGDEVNMECYVQDERTQLDLRTSNRTIEEALSDFVLDVHTTLRESGKAPVVWQEMLLTRDIALENDTIILVWISSEHVKKVVEKNFRIIHAASDYFYLDCGTGGWLGNSISNSWCDPFKTWAKAYSFDPYADVSPEQEHLILGGEALLWSEQVDSTNLDSLAWPRAAAIAEVFWTGSTLSDGSLRNQTKFLPRLQEWRYRALRRGVEAAPIQPEWCALRPGACDKS